MTFTTVLPSDSTTVFERTVEQATDFIDEIAPAIEEIHGIKYARPLNVTFAPWLVYEYGLGPISQFFSPAQVSSVTGDTSIVNGSDAWILADFQYLGLDAENIIDAGRAWQKLRGTPLAVTTALSWLDYANIAIEDQVRGRRRWHLYQIGMGELPGADEVNRLMNAEYLAGLSDPARSYFWRGYHGYDVRGHVYGRSRWGRSMWGDSSGVRLPGGKTKWSHGRPHAATAAGTSDDIENLGIADFGY